MTITLKLSKNTQQKMIKYFQDKKREKTPQYAIFQADEEDTVVTLYESGKAVFQGVSADIDANMWKEMERHLNPNSTNIELVKDKKEDKKDSKEKIMRYDDCIIGSDEVGTGDFFGPIIVTSAYVDKDNILFLNELKVKDSKKMTDDKIMEIVPKIIKKIQFETVILSNKDYNNYYSSDVNMNKIKAILHNRVLLALTSKIKTYNRVIVDQFTTPKSYFNYLKDAKAVYRNITFLTKAEDVSLSVACASLISRYYFLKKMDEMSREFGKIIPLGAGEKVNEVALEIAKEYGIDKLTEITKTNFKNMDKIKELMNN